jgi:hypothetical protein
VQRLRLDAGEGAIASITAMAVVVRILRACIGVSCLDQARA